MHPGSLLRHSRERLGLTYRDVERASYEIAARRGNSDFVVRISRLADIENRGVTPSIHKLYTLASVYHLSPHEVCRWYQVPLDEHFQDGRNNLAPRTHLAAPPLAIKLPVRFDPGFDPRRSALLSRMVQDWSLLEASMFNGKRHWYAYIGSEDRWMEPLIRPGSLLLIDPGRNRVQPSGWRNEYERPVYLIDIRDEYRCSWCMTDGNRLILQPHPLSPCAPLVKLFPGEAEVLGQVIGVAMRLPGS